MMDQRTYRKYKNLVDTKTEQLANKYMKEAIDEGIAKKCEHVTQINVAMNGSLNTCG